MIPRSQTFLTAVLAASRQALPGDAFWTVVIGTDQSDAAQNIAAVIPFPNPP